MDPKYSFMKESTVISLILVSLYRWTDWFNPVLHRLFLEHDIFYF